MSTSFAVIGPGAVGSVLARRWREAGLSCVGLYGRDPQQVAKALTFVGAGRELGDWSELCEAEVVAVTVSDPALAEVVAQAVAGGAVAASALWLHSSGVQGLEPLGPAAAVGAVVGALHPVCPVPDATKGYAAMPGQVALIEGSAEATARLAQLAEAAGMRPLRGRDVDRSLYHAACVLSANGTTALLGLCSTLVERATGLGDAASRQLVAGLAGAAAELSGQVGAAAALSGPVQRGDLEVVQGHRRSLEAVPGADDAYRALMTLALELARQRGLDETAAEALRRELGDG